MNSHTGDPAAFLRNSLRANAAFSALSGVTFTLAASSLSQFLGVPAVLVMATGVSLLGFAATLIWFSGRSRLSLAIAGGIVAADLSWVLGTLVALYLGLLTPDGGWAALGISVLVFLFAGLQSAGIMRVRGAG